MRRRWNPVWLACLLTGLALTTAADEPNWRHAWQHVLMDWVKSLEEADVQTKVIPVDPAKLDPAMAGRDVGLYKAYAAPISTIAATVRLPATSFLWPEIWKADLPLAQEVLREDRMNVGSGQIWTPTKPAYANLLAWGYAWNEKWNPYYHNKAVARRAAVISIIDLVMRAEEYFYYNSGKSSFDGAWHAPGTDRYSDHALLYKNMSGGAAGGEEGARRFLAAYAPGSGNIYTPFLGFAMTFNAFTLLNVKDMLPDEVRGAWSEGLAFLLSKLAAARTGQGPANMELSLPTAFYYGFLATGDKALERHAEEWAAKIVYAGRYSAAGHYKDGAGPDGSYNGIALHRVAELWSITRWPKLVKHLRACYRLKGLMTLVEPDGSWLSPSHFNERTPQSFANDQYRGREVQFAVDVPEAAPFLRRLRPSETPPDKVAAGIARASTRGKADGAMMYSKTFMHGWGHVLSLPYFIYYQDVAALKRVKASGPTLPIEQVEPFVENVNNEFICVKRPGYYVILYTGPISTSDEGATNYRGMFGGEGGIFNGFAGGGISAFWTPAGTMVLGRLSSYEGYVRKTRTFDWGKYLIPGWQDWANNHIIGETVDGKILTSARTSSPRCSLDRKRAELVIDGEFVTELPRQGAILGNRDHRPAYRRRYVFRDDRVDVQVSASSKGARIPMKTLYETLPAFMPSDMVVHFLDKSGKELASDGLKHVRGVRTIGLQRDKGRVDIEFDTAVGVALVSEVLKSGNLKCRALQVAFPQAVVGGRGEPTTLSYRIVPRARPRVQPDQHAPAAP